MAEADPITLALVQNRLDQIAKQMGWVMIRTSRSPIFNQSHDFSCFITDAEGMLVSQADGIPIHTGGGGFAVRALLETFAGRILEDDVFLLNDPYVAGGNHLPDWVVARPVFAEGRLIAFACNRAHQSDIGGGAAGTYNPQATEIFHEGIRLPPLKLVEQGSTRDDLWQLLMINSRCPELLDGDLRAMLGATRVGVEELRKVVDDFGLVATVALFGEILDYADRRLRAAILELPDGVYRAEERYDNDCFSAMRVDLRLTLTKSADRITVDFTGTAPQIRGFKNSSLANTYSAVYAGIASFFDSDLPRNEGTFRSVSIVAPRGTVVNAVAPAPLTMCTVFPAHEIMHMIWWALGQADPKRSIAGWGKNVFPVTSGRDAENVTWVMYNWGGNSGAGAVAGRDGFNQMGPMITLGGLVIPNMETYEQLYPITVHRHELRPDGGGPGHHRGGTGVEFEVDIKGAAEYSFRGEGTTRPTGLGVEAGRAGAIGEVRVAGADRASWSPDPYCLKELGPVRLTIRSPGGGGFGNPFDRPVELVVRDVQDGLVSRAAAESDYGVVLEGDDYGVDNAATERLRREKCSGS
ncbi:hydantoinase B/oxoprolinase family protein [Reyranella sp.]|uniref:hydantoinase B/oxoprolinase family protein n=1 Tax=Reyranella sp. TaxID=1929291 RepID=UPI003784A1B1